MKSKKPLLVLTTVAKKSDAIRLSKLLVEKKLAACVTTLPAAESRYQWKGKLCVEKEFVLLIKTTEKGFSKLKSSLESIHPYDCPEILGIPVSKISEKYANWVFSSVN